MFENGQTQQLANFATEAPFEIALLLDTSGSTRADVALIRRAANAFIDALRPAIRIASWPATRGGAMNIATVEWAKLTSDRKALRDAVERLGAVVVGSLSRCPREHHREVVTALHHEFRGPAWVGRFN